jgi:hypothetical protein
VFTVYYCLAYPYIADLLNVVMQAYEVVSVKRGQMIEVALHTCNY